MNRASMFFLRCDCCECENDVVRHEVIDSRNLSSGNSPSHQQCLYCREIRDCSQRNHLANILAEFRGFKEESIDVKLLDKRIFHF